MAGHREVSVEVAYGFGSFCGSGLRDGALFGDDNGHHLLHPTGRYVMLRHMDGNEANFILSDERVEAITACAVSRDRAYLAVAEKRSAAPMRRVAVYDFQQNLTAKLARTLEVTGISASARLVSLAFSADGSLLAAVTGSPEPTALVLDWRQDGRVVAKKRLEMPADRVHVSPQPGPVGEQVALLVSVSGPRLLRVLQLRDYPSKIRDSSLKLMPGFSGMAEVRITDHSWVEPGDGTLVSSIAAGTVYILDSQDLTVIRAIESPFGKITGHRSTVPLCVRCFSQGFIVGGGEGMLAIWEKVDNAIPEDDEGEEEPPQEFKHAGTVRLQPSGKADAICSLDMPGAEESILVGFQNANIALVNIMSIYSSKTGICDCRALSGGFHSGPIAGLDMAVQRPLVASVCKQDSSLRIWNYITRQCEIRWSFPNDPPLAVALHPFGYFMAVSFNEKLRFFYILDTSLQLQSEWTVQGVKLLRFSNGGHLIAAAQGKLAHIFSMRTYAKVATLDAHGHHITSLCFDHEDHALWTLGHDGTLCQWDALGWAKMEEHRSKGCEYLAASSSSGGTVCCSAARGGECVLRRFAGCALEQELVVPGPAQLSSICTFAGSSAVFGGTSAGVLRIHASPVAGEKVREVALHAGACSHMLLSVDGRTLVTGGEDGAIFVMNVVGLARGESGPEHLGDLEARMVGADIVLVNRAAILKRQEECERLRAETNMLKAKIEAEAKALEEECQRKVEEARVKAQAEIQELGRRCGALEQAFVAKEREGQRIMKSMEETHLQAYGQLNHLYEKKMEHEADRYEALEQRREQLLAEIEQTKEETEQKLQREQEEAEAELARELMEKDLAIQKHKDLVAFTSHRFESLLQADGVEHDDEIAEMKLKSHAVLEEQKQIEVQLKKEQDTLQKGHDLMTQEKERLEREQQDSAILIRSLKEHIEDYKGSLSSLKAETKDRESTLHDKEQKIENYKLKVNKLKKFKHVLDKQLSEVTESLQPKDETIDQMKKTLKELEAEFEVQLGEQRSMEADVRQRSQHLSCLASEQQQLQEAIKDKDRIIAHYTNDLHALISEPLDERLWPQEIRRLYHTHVCGLCPYEERMPVEKMQLQMRQAERRVSGLGVKSRQQKAMCKADIQKKSNENAMLVHEVNELRVQKKQLQNQIKHMTVKLAGVSPGEGSTQVAIEDMSRRPKSEEASPSAPAAPLPSSASSSSLPRTPSGSLPGPRQQTSAKALGELATEPRQARTRSVPPLGKGRAMPVSFEDQNRIQSVLASAEWNAKHYQAQKTESTVLRYQIDSLLQEWRAASSRASTSRPASRASRPASRAAEA